MKNILLASASLVILSALLFIPGTTYAQDPLEDACSGAGASSAACRGRSVNNPVDFVLVDVIRLVLLVTGIAAVIVIIIGGLRYITSSGDPNSIEGAKNTILFAIIGLVIALTGQLIIAFVIQRL